MIKWIFLSVVALQMGCSMKMKKDTAGSVGLEETVGTPFSWETKAAIKDIRKNKINQVTIDMIAIKNQKLRIEASATLGYQVGSLVMNQVDFIAVIYPQKKIIKGPLNDRSLSKTFNMPIPPTALYSIAYDEPIRGWKCQFDSNKIVSLCDSGASKVEWLNRKDGAKLIKISSATVEINWFFKAPEPKALTDELFVAELPIGYQVQEVR
ncbi:MAG: hypothetical protein JNL11_14825 [Bdellovibrionaceae bacterium]|nr:hypothetical protein [Pseudobdellovibrionaceae bacterium]